jgi:hypothetical protein
LEEVRVASRWRADQDEWVEDFQKITSSENLSRIRDMMESRGSILVAHWIYRGGGSPVRVVFDDFGEFMAYVQTAAAGGDALDVWLVEDLCTPSNRFATGMVPDLDGRTPRRGSY